MSTILDTLKKGTEYLEKYGIEEPRLNMEHLVAHALRCQRMQIYLDFDKPLDEPQLELLRDLVRKRSKGEPLQHLLGSVEFCGFEFKTDGRALIPRPETEELAEKLSEMEWNSGLRILDLGCGSGVLGLSLAKLLKSKEVHLTLADISEDALTLARENAEPVLGDDAGNVQFLQSDLFESVEGHFDLIAANLPYIPQTDAPTLSREVLRDPPIALYGGESGTELILRFLNEAGDYLNNSGRIGIEYGIGQAEELRIAAEDAGFEDVIIRKDLSGHERFLFASKSP